MSTNSDSTNVKRDLRVAKPKDLEKENLKKEVSMLKKELAEIRQTISNNYNQSADGSLKEAIKELVTKKEEFVKIRYNGLKKIILRRNQDNSNGFELEDIGGWQEVDKQLVDQIMQYNSNKRWFRYGLCDFNDNMWYTRYGIYKEFSMDDESLLNLILNDTAKAIAEFSKVREAQGNDFIMNRLAYKIANFRKNGKLSTDQHDKIIVALSEFFGIDTMEYCLNHLNEIR